MLDVVKIAKKIMLTILEKTIIKILFAYKIIT